MVYVVNSFFLRIWVSIYTASFGYGRMLHLALHMYMLIHAWPFFFGCGLCLFSASHFICNPFCVQRPLLWIWAYVIHSFLRNRLFVFGGYVVLSALSSGFGLPSFVFSNKETLCFRTHVALNQKQKQANVENHFFEFGFRFWPRCRLHFF